MGVFLTAHAARRAKQRSITLGEIREALAHRETVHKSHDSDEKVVILGVTDGQRRLKIVVLADDEECVVTVADRDGEG